MLTDLLKVGLKLSDVVVGAGVVVKDLKLELSVPVTVAQLARGDLGLLPLGVRVVLKVGAVINTH